MNATYEVIDATEGLERLENEVNTWIVDPPYNIGFDYGENFKDSFTDYPSFIHDISKGMYEKTTDEGSFFFIHYPEDCARLLKVIEKAGWVLHQWISWVYPSNIGMSKKRFTTASRAVLWFSKGIPKFKHHVKGEYKNPTDARIKERIKQGHAPPLYDWWHINMCKNVSKDYAGYFNQIPYELLKRLILNTTEEGDTVGDCCAGSGSVLLAALKLKRNSIGFDINPEGKKRFTIMRQGVLV